MHYHLNKYLISNLTNYLRRVFRYNSQWVNLGVEIVQFSSGSEQLVFEQFYNENEKYPVITLGSNGGSITPFGFNDFLTTGADSVEIIGNRNLSMVILSSNAPVAFSLTDNLLTKTLGNISLKGAWSQTGGGGDDITVNLYKDYLTTPILVASGSLSGITEITFQDMETELFPTITLDQQDYWIELQVASGSDYYIGIDTTRTTKYISGTGSIQSTGSVVGFVRFPSSLTFGGLYECNMVFRCMSKNQTAQAYDLSELIIQYLSLGKHAVISRESDAIDGMELPTISYSNSSGTLSVAGINIKDIRIGAVENRRRGEKDLIFTVPISLTVMTEWSQQFNANYLKDTTAIPTAFYDTD
jgi:hypothetical protein